MNNFKKALLLGLLAVSCNSAQAMFTTAFTTAARHCTRAVPAIAVITATAFKKKPMFEAQKEKAPTTFVTALIVAMSNSNIMMPENDSRFLSLAPYTLCTAAYREPTSDKDLNKNNFKTVCTLAAANYCAGEFIGIDLGPEDLAYLVGHIDTLKHSAECKCAELKEKIENTLAKGKKS